MNEDDKKGIEIKNIADIYEENLRIENQNQEEDNDEIDDVFISEEESDIANLNFRNPELGNKIIGKFRKLLHREIRDWIIEPLQKKQTTFNQKVVGGIEQNRKRVESSEHDRKKKEVSNEKKIADVNEKINSLIRELKNKNEVGFSKDFVSIQKNLEIESIVKQKFLDILKRYPTEKDLDYFVNEIRTGKINVSDFENKIINTTEYRNLKLLEHSCIYTKFGTKMYLDKNDNVISKDLAIKQVWEPEETEILRNSIKEGMNVVDIGANIGYYTVLFSKWVGDKGKVFSFEPEPENYDLLRKNMQANQVKNATTFQKAISNQNEIKSLFLSDENRGDHKIIDLKENEAQVEIECKKLDSTVVSEHKIDFIKMDIQGAEMLALEGMSKVLENNPNVTLLIEFWPYGIENSGYSPKDLLDKLEKFGFKIFQIEGKKIIPLAKNFPLIAHYSKEDFTNLICKKG